MAAGGQHHKQLAPQTTTRIAFFVQVIGVKTSTCWQESRTGSTTAPFLIGAGNNRVDRRLPGRRQVFLDTPHTTLLAKLFRTADIIRQGGKETDGRRDTERYKERLSVTWLPALVPVCCAEKL